MCGIAALFLQPQARPPEVWQALRDNFTQNLLFNEKRGQEATGIAMLNVQGQLEVYKASLPAAEFVRTPRFIALLQTLGPQTTLLLGHTRFPTKGSPQNPQNNHPIQVGPICGVHNGHIQNDDALFAQEHLLRQAQVDSEIIFQLLAPYSAAVDPAHYLHDIRPVMQQMRGQHTFLAADTRAPHRLLVVKHGNPLSAHYHQPWQALVFSSRYIFLRKTFGPSARTQPLPHDHLLLYDTTLLTSYTSQPVHLLPLFVK